jgi:hypothetical protein
LLLLAALLCAGCTPSLVYSPSLLLPAQPLVKEDVHLVLGTEMLPETRPEAFGIRATAGGSVGIRYAFSDRLTLGLKGWDALDDGRGGASAEGIVMLSDKGPYRLALIPRTGLVLSEGGTIEGGGITLPVAIWAPPLGALHPYGALGPIVGWRDLGASPGEWGYGAVGNLGMAIEISKVFAVNLEVAGIVQVNRYDHTTHAIADPALSLSWRF